MKKILLVSPLPLGFELTQDESFLRLPFMAKAFMMPLAIATVAALTPDGFEVDMWDEALHGRIKGAANFKGYDLVGVTGYIGHLPRAKEIGKICRQAGIPVVIGGSGVTRVPHTCVDDFDHLILGEAELTWPQFLADWTAGKARQLYRQGAPVDLALTPAPRWGNIAGQAQGYILGAVQTSRGCPFDCEFCDVPIVLGRGYRCKPVDNVLQEVIKLERLGFKAVVFCDDNFIGKVNYAKELLRKLIPLNNSFRHPLRFGSEMSINMAMDEELLELLADANFVEFFVGIESPNEESLKEMQKYHNARRNLVDDIRKVQSYGVPIRGALIVGFDHDNKDIFDRHLKFVQDAFLCVPSVRILMASPGTRLWKRIRGDGRLLKTVKDGRFYGNAGTTNIIPKNMTRAELQSGFLDLRKRVYDWETFAHRVKGFVSNVKRRPNIPRRRYELKLLIQFVSFLFSSRVDMKTRRVILGILLYTLKQAPFMMSRVARIILRQFSYANTQKMQEVAQKQIDMEESGELKWEVDQSEPIVPEGFYRLYEAVFPEVKAEVCQGLEDKTHSAEALIEIFTKFLSRWSPTNKSLTEEDRSHLMKLTKEAVAEKNNGGANRTSGASSSSTGINSSVLRRKYLPEDILRAVEQELMMGEARR